MDQLPKNQSVASSHKSVQNQNKTTLRAENSFFFLNDPAPPDLSSLPLHAPLPISCAPPSGSFFVVGAPVVNCSATNSRNKTATGSFNVNVDAPAPVLHLPADITTTATSPSGATVSFTATATDVVDITVPVICVPASGSVFALGSTTVNCSATNSHGKTT